MNRTGLLPDTLTALAGLAFAVLLLFGFATVDPLVEATDQELIAWWSDSGNQTDMARSMYFMLAAVPCFLVFAAGLRARLASAEGGEHALGALLYAFAIAFATVFLIGDVARGAVAHSVRFADEPLPGPETLRTLTVYSQLSLGIVAMPLSALALATASWGIIRTKCLGAWLGWAGLAVAAIILVFVAFLAGPWASPFLQLWVVAASFELWRTRHRASASASVASSDSQQRIAGSQPG